MKNISRQTAKLVNKYLTLVNLNDSGIIGALANLGLLLNEIVKLSHEGTVDIHKKIRSHIYRLFTELESFGEKNQLNKDTANFLSIIRFLKQSLSRRQRSVFIGHRPVRKKRFKGCSISTLSTYAYQLVPSLNFASQRNKLFGELSIDDLRLYVKHYPSSIGTLKRLLKVLRHDGQAIQCIDFADPSLVPKKTKMFLSFFPSIFSDAFFSLSRNEQVGILLGLASLRESEIASAKTDNIMLDEPLSGMVVVGKGEKERFIPLEFFPLLEAALKADQLGGTHVISKSSGQRYTPSGLANVMRNSFRKLGFRSMNPQFLRHICATSLSLMGIPLRDIKAVLGHAFEKTTVQEYHHGQAYYAYRILSQSTAYERLFEISPQAMSVKDSARILKIGERNVQIQCKRGKIEAYKSKGEWFIREPDLLKYIFERGT